MFTDQQIRELERRILAASIDVALWAGCWYALFRAFAQPAESRSTTLWLPAAITLGLVATAELLTGITPGKWLTGLRVRSQKAATPTLATLLLRGALRLLPLAILLLVLPIQNSTAYLAAFATAATLATCYLCAAYLTFIRYNLSPFDLAAGTVATRSAESSRS